MEFNRGLKSSNYISLGDKMENTQKVSETNKLIYKILKDATSKFEEMQYVSLMANGLLSQAEVEKQIDLKKLCIKYNLNYQAICIENGVLVQTPEDRIQILRERQIKTSMIPTRCGKTVPDLKLRTFEKKYEQELNNISNNYREIEQFVYNKANNNEVNEDFLHHYIEYFFDIEYENAITNRKDCDTYFRAVKAFFRALRQGKIIELEKKIK